ncbi:hypothetical protein [uncultured Trichococcus sp.]|uniref:hypothetical protein n=1 Tax=uncultured Trichococcus sp. TaxID=189665 RepID=UPI0029C8FA01|nr:hypothetical protein [uncultured Trichococcus sp.]
MAKKIVKYDVLIKSTKQTKQFDIPKIYTNDLNSVVFQFVVSDLTVEEQAAATAITMIYMRDGSFFQNPSTDVDKVGNTFSYTLKENEGNHAGIAKIQLVVTIPGTPAVDYASQLYEFDIVNGLETKVAQEVMIYDWTTLTRDAQDYIDTFVANEATRQQQFADAQTQRGTTFGESEAGRTTTFNASEAGRTTTFNASEAGRTTAFNAAEEARATGYDADHSRAGTDHTTAVNDHTLAGTDHSTAANDHTLAGTDHTRAESDHTRADADSATVAGFNTRLTAEETATAANKVSAVKGKTFADVDARFEDVEVDTTAMGTSLVANGDFSNGKTGWIDLGLSSSSRSVVNSELVFTVITPASVNGVYQMVNIPDGNTIYFAAKVFPSVSSQPVKIGFDGQNIVNNKTIANQWNLVSRTDKITTGNIQKAIVLSHETTNYTANQTFKFDDAIVIDLTAAFGKGNEPTAEQMDGILAKFTNSWFDGTKNLFRANASLNKLMAVDARTEFEAKNDVANGDFSNGTTGWLGIDGALSVSNNEGTLTLATTSLYSRLNYSTTLSAGKYYFRFGILPKYANAITCYTSLNAATKSIVPTANVWNAYSNIMDITVSGAQTIFFLQTTAANYIAGDIIKFKNMAVINLTAAFGAGKEPTLAEMDRLMARFPNSWFDGVKPIQTIETLYQEKANKVQEAWITPTLLNGWTEVSGYPVRYMKDDMGFVHMKGKVTGGTLVSRSFTLPIGYRILGSVVKFQLIGSTSTSCVVQVQSDGAVSVMSGTNTDICLDGIPPFRID